MKCRRSHWKDCWWRAVWGVQRWSKMKFWSIKTAYFNELLLASSALNYSGCHVRASTCFNNHLVARNQPILIFSISYLRPSKTSQRFLGSPSPFVSWVFLVLFNILSRPLAWSIRGQSCHDWRLYKLHQHFPSSSLSALTRERTNEKRRQTCLPSSLPRTLKYWVIETVKVKHIACFCLLL